MFETPYKSWDEYLFHFTDDFENFEDYVEFHGIERAWRDYFAMVLETIAVGIDEVESMPEYPKGYLPRRFREAAVLYRKTDEDYE